MASAVKFDKYDRYKDIHWRTSKATSLRLNAPLVSRYNSVLRHSPAGRKLILDIGCGDGRLTYLLGQKFPSASVIGIDSELAGVEVARQKVELLEVENIRFEHNTDGKFDFADSTFDLIVMTDVIEHLTQPSAMLGSISRMLSSGGCAVITTPNRQLGPKWDERHEHEFDGPELARLLKGYFDDVLVYGTWPMQRVRIGKTLFGRAFNDTLTRVGLNPYDKEMLNPTSAFGQLTAVCHKTSGATS